jgi:hypothetical protein
MSATVIPGLTLGGEPRVQLLPPSVKLREKARSTRQLMVLLVILAMVVAGAGTFGAFWLAQQAESELAAEQARTLDLLAEQTEYSEGASVAAQVAATENAQRAVTANEIDWLELTTTVMGYVSCECTPYLSFSGPAPWEPALIPEGPLRPARIATMTVDLEGTEFVWAAPFVAEVRKIPEVADAVIQMTVTEDGLYITTIVVTFDADALAKRFSLDDGTQSTDTDDGTSEDASPATPTPTPTPTEGTNP